MNTKEFEVNYYGLKLKFTFYTFEYILTDLYKVFKKNYVTKYDLSIYRKWSQIRTDCNSNLYFTYIKFFKENTSGIKYGIVGGKTNYNNPDIVFDDLKPNDNRISRVFLHDTQLSWCNKIIVIHHPNVSQNEDNMQAKFIEKYVQRKYNLFDS